MDIRVFKDLFALHGAEIAIKKCHSKEVCPNCALKRSSYLNHPVDHLCAVLLAHIVAIER